MTTVVPSGPSCPRKNVGNGLTPILATDGYHERLVKCGEHSLSLDFLSWRHESLLQINAGKCGRPVSVSGTICRGDGPHPRLTAADYINLFHRISQVNLSQKVTPELLAEGRDHRRRQHRDYRHEPG